jgi:hypothetical protein
MKSLVVIVPEFHFLDELVVIHPGIRKPGAAHSSSSSHSTPLSSTYRIVPLAVSPILSYSLPAL